MPTKKADTSVSPRGGRRKTKPEPPGKKSKWLDRWEWTNGNGELKTRIQEAGGVDSSRRR
jgi:hypothetical protein